MSKNSFSTTINLMISLIVTVMIFVSPAALAKSAADCKAQSFFGIPTWYQYLVFDEFCNPSTDVANATILILLAIMDIILYLGGFLAAFYIIYGGFQFILAQGASEKITNARKAIIDAVIGLIIIIVASQVVGFIAKRVAGL